MSRAGSERRARKEMASSVEWSLQCRSSSHSTTGRAADSASSAWASSRSMRCEVAPAPFGAGWLELASHGICASQVGAKDFR